MAAPGEPAAAKSSVGGGRSASTTSARRSKRAEPSSTRYHSPRSMEADPPSVAPTANLPPLYGTFNFAEHLLRLNRTRIDKVAYVDDRGELTYGALGDGVRRMASAFLAAGVRREERVLLLMHDCNDWPVCFLGALYAGIVPVAVNTLEVAESYAYMLENSRAQAVVVSAALLPVFTAALEMAKHEVRTVLVSRADGALIGAEPLERVFSAHEPLPSSAETMPGDPGFWLYSSGSTGRPKG